MCDFGGLPVLNNLIVEKEGNETGSIRVSGLPNCTDVEVRLVGSLPFASTNLTTSIGADNGNPDTARQHIFEACVHLLRLSFDGQIAPYRFIDGNGNRWRMDASAAFWLNQSGRWSIVERNGEPCFGLRLEQNTHPPSS